MQEGRQFVTVLGKKSFRESSGQEVVEFALILPLLLLLLLGILEFTLAVFSYNTVANAAREGARAGVVPDATVEEIEAAVYGRATGVNLTSVAVTLTSATVTVTVTYDHHLLIGAIVQAVGGDPVLHLSTTATMQTE
jgi:Flp pilus assembly protein TadG